jgi:hypothetical protein
MKLTPQQRSQAQLDQRWHAHRQCKCAVQQRGPHWGVYCADHGTWIQWIAQDQAQQILAEKTNSIYEA